MLVLRQSTSIDIRIGPAMDAGNGVDPETGVGLVAADQAEVLKANGAATVTMGGAFSAVSGCDGWYDYTVATGDVDTIGEVIFVVQDSTLCLPMFVKAMVMEPVVYDAIYADGATGIASGIALASALATVDNEIYTLQGNVTDILADTNELQSDDLPGLIATLDAVVDTVKAETVLILEDTANIQANYATASALATVDTVVDGIQTDLSNGTDGLGAIKSACATATGFATEAKQDVIDGIVDQLNLGIIYGVAETGTLSTTQATTNITGYTADQLVDAVIIVTSGDAEGERKEITASAVTDGLLTFGAMTEAMANGDTFKIV